MNKQQLAAKIWESANKMRSKIEANEYKDYILGFIFYKFLSEKEVKYLKDNDWTDDDLKLLKEDDTETVESVQKNIGYFISYDNLFSTWLGNNDFDVSNVTDALNAFNRLIGKTHKKVFEKIFDTLSAGLSKLGDTSGSQTKAIGDLLELIKDIPMDDKQGYDVLGFIYEYLISNFAANAGKKAGEFYTPHEVSVLMSEIVANHLKNQEEIRIYDPTSGSGSLLINIGKSVAKHMGDGNKIKYYAQELKENTYNLTRMNLVMRGIIPDNIVTRNADTLADDWPYFDDNDPVNTYEPLYVDAVVSNPPYSQHWTPPQGQDKRFKEYGIAPKGKADYAFLLHDLFHLKPKGIMCIVLPHGVLFRGGEEAAIRTNLIENNKIDIIIGLPANIFFGTGIPTIVMVLKQNKNNDDVLIIDASKGFEKVGKNNKLRACDIKKIVDVIVSRQSVPKFSKVVSRDEIRKNEYNLNIPRYVDSSDKPENWDLYASMFGGVPQLEVADYNDYWDALPALKSDLFVDTDKEYLHFRNDDIKKTVVEHNSVQQFKDKFVKAFDGFDGYLKHELIDYAETLNVNKEEEIISKDIFSRLANVALVNPYDAYQIFDNEWNKISTDLEIIQTEGFNATTQVDPNMIEKKKGEKKIEVQDSREGWKGHILPFDIVQNRYFKNELNELAELQERIDEIPAEFEELLEQLADEDKEKDFVNEDKTAFVAAEVKKVLKEESEEQDILDILKKYQKLADELKKVKKKHKDKFAALHLATKEKIEGLTHDEVCVLLNDKWVLPVVEGINKLPVDLFNNFGNKMVMLQKKYETTFAQVQGDIDTTEQELSKMLDDLTGNDFDMQGLNELKKLLGDK